MHCFCFKSNKFVGAVLKNVTSSYEFSCDINTVNVRILGNLESSNKIRWRLLLLVKHSKARAISSDALNLRIQSEYRKIWTRNNSVFGHFSRSDGYKELPRLYLPITFTWVITFMWLNKMSFYDLFFHLSKIDVLQLKLILFWEMIFSLKINLKSYMKFHSLRNGVLFVLAWVAWVVCLRGWRASVCGVGGVLAWVAWVACHCYFYCYY